MDPLPIDEVADAIGDALSAHPNLVLIAPPGAGKTTRVPQLLIDRGLVASGQQVLVLEPRRIAVRLAAHRIATERNVRVGAEVGYVVRLESKRSKNTRILFVTEGILTRMAAGDPLLENIGAVVVDEFHERSIHADLALAFVREIQETVRPDLHILVMSATLDPKPVAKFLGDAPVIESQGRTYPIEVRYREREPERRLEDEVAADVRRALRENAQGDVLTFLPGVGEIRRTEERLRERLVDGVEVHQLFGEQDPKKQDAVMRSARARKVILATNVAESSVTIPGVRVVVDGGFEKRLAHDRGTGIDRLELVRISRRSAEQRSGRAGRLGPGVAYRTWSDKQHARLSLDQPAEIHRIDLAATLLMVLSWSESDPLAFGWFEAPSARSVQQSLELLQALGALRDGYRLTDRGRQLSRLPLHPRLATLLIEAANRGFAEHGATLAAIAAERDFLRADERASLTDRVGDSDLLVRAAALSRSSSGAARRITRLAQDLRRHAPKEGSASEDREVVLLKATLCAFPDRVAKRLDGDEPRYALVDGGQAVLARESVVKDAPLIVAVETSGTSKNRPLIRAASRVEEAWLDVDRVEGATWNRERDAAEGTKEVRYRGLLLHSKPSAKVAQDVLERALLGAATGDLERALPRTKEWESLINRLRFAREHAPDRDWPGLEPDPRIAMLPHLVRGKRSFKDLKNVDLVEAFVQHLEYGMRTALAKIAPAKIAVPSGNNVRLRYEHEGPPVLSVRLQEVFGLYETPRVAGGRVAVKMELLAPNRRPVQVTQDLANFWKSTYAEVRKELRRRYPKHQWPEDPRQGIPSAKTKKNLKRR